MDAAGLDPRKRLTHRNSRATIGRFGEHIDGRGFQGAARGVSPAGVRGVRRRARRIGDRIAMSLSVICQISTIYPLYGKYTKKVQKDLEHLRIQLSRILLHLRAARVYLSQRYEEILMREGQLRPAPKEAWTIPSEKGPPLRDLEKNRYSP